MSKRRLIPILALAAVVPLLLVDLDDVFAAPIPPNTYSDPSTSWRDGKGSNGVPLVIHTNNNSATLQINPHVTSYDHYRNNPINYQQGDITIDRGTKILPNSVLASFSSCTVRFGVQNVGSNPANADDHNYAKLPTDVDSRTYTNPSIGGDVRALGVDFKQYSGCDVSALTTPNSTNSPLITDKEMRVTIYGQAGKKAFFSSHFENITTAQLIPECTSANFDNSTNPKKLKGDTRMCHGTYGGDLVIITKQIGEYGSTSTILPPDTLPIPPPSGFPTTLTTSDVPYLKSSLNIDNGTLGTSAKRYQIDGTQPGSLVKAGDIHIQGTTTILSNPILLDLSTTCAFNIVSLPALSTAFPTNVQPAGNASNPASIAFSGQSTCANWSPTHPMITDKEMRITLTNKTGSKAWYASPSEGITEAQPIPACTDDMIHKNQTLKGRTKMCYGVYSDDLIIVTKRFFGQYGSADTITPPQNSVDLDSSYAIPPGTLSIPPPSGFPTSLTSSDAPYISAQRSSDNGTIGATSAKRYQIDGNQNVPVRAGDIYIQGTTTILSNPFFVGKGYTCPFNIFSLHTERTYHGGGFAYPTNVQPTGNATNPASMTFHGDSTCENWSPTHPMITDKEMRITLDNKTGSKAWYASPRQNITEAQPIPACTTDTINVSTGKLKGNTKMCYGVYDGDLIIITKRFLGYYGSADTITTPQNPVDLDSDKPTSATPPPTPGQTLTITIPVPNDGNITSAPLSLDHNTPNKARFINNEVSPGSGTRYHDLIGGHLGNITIHYNTNITSQTFTVPSNPVNYCYTAQAKVGQFTFSVPKINSYTVITYLDISKSTLPRCTSSVPDISFDGKLTLDKEVYIKLTGTDGQNIFYHVSGTDTPVEIPKCTSTNFDSSDNTLKGNTEVCYGKDGTDTVIVSKILARFGATTEDIPKSSTPDPGSQDLLTIPPKTNSTVDGAVQFNSDKFNSGKIFYSGSPMRFLDKPNPTGDIYIESNTETLPNSLFVITDDYACDATLDPIKSLKEKQVPNFVRPDNVSPKNNRLFGFGLDFESPCSTPSPETPSNQTIFTDKEMRVTLYGKADKKPYYFSPRDGILQAQPIPACTSDIIHTSNNTLRGDNTICYGKHGDDMVIITKRLAGFYGAANKVTTPTNPVNLNADPPYPSPKVPRETDLLRLSPPANFPALNTDGRSLSVTSDPTTAPGAYLAGNDRERYTGHQNTRIGDMHIKNDTKILPNEFPETSTCRAQFRTVNVLIADDNYGNLTLKVPTNLIADSGSFGPNFLASDTCKIDLTKNSAKPLLTDKELWFTLYNKVNEHPYYFSPRENITDAQPIPACTTETLDKSDNTLKGDTIMCFAKHTNDNDIVIITKRLSGFYGAAALILEPTTRAPINPVTPSTPVPPSGTVPVTVPVTIETAFPLVTDPKSHTRMDIPIRSLGADVGGLLTENGTFRHGYLDLGDSGIESGYTGPIHVGYVYLPPNTKLDPNPSFAAVGKNTFDANLLPTYIKQTLFTDSNTLGVPAFGFFYEPGADYLESDDKATMFKPHETNSTIRVVLYNQTGKAGFSYYPLGPAKTFTPDFMSKCTASNFDFTTLLLKGDTKDCYYDNNRDIIIFTKILEWYGAADDPSKSMNKTAKSDKSDTFLSLAPTFGRSQFTGEQLVTCGYTMDDTCRDVTAYHVRYERDTIQTNTTHTFALKAHAPNLLNNVMLAFSVPTVGAPLSAAEAHISVNLGINYSEPSYHYITDVTIHDPNNIIDYDIQGTTVSKVSCSGGTLECIQVILPDVLFRDVMNHEPFAIQVTDTLSLNAINYMNEGVFVEGTSLNAPPTVRPGLTLSSDDGRPVNLVLVRTDKVSDLWADAFGNTWSRNSFGNFVIVQYAPYAGTTPVCTDINDRICTPFKIKLDWHNQKMIELRDSLYNAYKTEPYAEIDNIFTYEFGDMDSRTRTLMNLGWLTE